MAPLRHINPDAISKVNYPAWDRREAEKKGLKFLKNISIISAIEVYAFSEANASKCKTKKRPHEAWRRNKMKKLKGFIYIFLMLISLIGLVTSLTAFALEIPRIQPEELKKMIERGDASFLVVDVQPKGAYDLGHIKGAVNFPWDKEIKGPVNLPQSKLLILYCDCGHEEDSIDIAKQLMENWEYLDIKVLEGGWSQWRKLGYPIEKNK